MHAQWCVQAAQCSVCAVRVACAGLQYGASVVVHSDSAVGHVGGAVHADGALHAGTWQVLCMLCVHTLMRCALHVRADINVVRADIGAVCIEIGAVQCGCRFTGA